MNLQYRIGWEQRLAVLENQLKEASQRVRFLKKMQNDERRTHFTTEIFEAWRQRDFAEFWKLCRRLGHNCRGPRKRRYAMATTQRTADDQYVEFFAKAGCEGGMGGIKINFEEEYADVKAHAEKPPLADVNDITGAHEGIKHLKWALRRARHRRVVPAGSAPVDVWATLCHSSNVKKDVFLKEGVGLSRQTPETFAFRRWLRNMMEQVRRTRATPLKWQRSRVVGLDKGNFLRGPEAKRHIPVLDHMGKCYFKCLLHKQLYKPTYPPSWHGCIEGRRRQGAIATKLILSHRLRRLGRSHITSYFDVKNAYASQKHLSFEVGLWNLLEPQDVEIGSHTCKQCCLTLYLPSGLLYILQKEGGMQGLVMIVYLILES